MKYPFKFLDSYGKDDTDIFFGRVAEIRDLYKMVLETNIVWVYGPSGTGKTSLIQCGLASKFRDYEWLYIRILRGNNISQSLETALNLEMGNEISINEDINKLFYSAGKSSTTEITRQTTAIEKKIQGIYLQYFKPIYLIFDQFEELFILGDSDEYHQFVANLKDLLKTEYPVKLIFVIREDYLGYLYELEKSIPGLMKKKLRIAPVDRDKAVEILTEIGKPGVSLVTLQKDKEEAVAGEIFEKVKEKENSITIQLPYLQIFLDKLYIKITGDEEAKQTEAVFTLDNLRTIGNIDDVLKVFLDDQVTAIAKDQKKDDSIIWDVLSHFVSLEKTKKPISKENLYARVNELPKPVVDDIVKALGDKRIVRYVPETAMYELAHDSLAERIALRRNTHDTALLEKSSMITGQIKVYELIGSVFTEKELALIEPFLKDLETKKMIDEKGRELINRSREDIEATKEAETQRRIEKDRKEAEKKAKEQRDELERKLEKEKSEWLERVRKRRVWFLSISLVISLALTAWAINSLFLRNRAQKRESENRYLSVAGNLLRADNPTLSYQVLKLGAEKIKSDTLKSQMAEYERSGYIYLQGIYPALSDVLAFNLSPRGVLTIDEEFIQSAWNTNRTSLPQTLDLRAQSESKRFPIFNDTLMVSISSNYDSIIIGNAEHNVLQKLPATELLFSDLENIKVSAGGRLLSAGNHLYKLSGDLRRSVSHTLPLLSFNDEGPKKNYNVTAVSILNDTLVAAGYENGNIVLYSLTDSAGKLKKIKSLSSSNWDIAENSRILRIATDRKGRYLFAVDGFNVINVWDLNKTQSIEFTTLLGHTGAINCLEFSVDNTMMLSGSDDNTALVWDISGKDIIKKSTLRGPNSSGIVKAAFFNNDKDIVTVTNEGTVSKVYLWKHERPFMLSKNDQLYHFSAFDFDIWGLRIDTSTRITTSELYHTTLNDYLNLPITNDFPNDKNYTQIWSRSLAQTDRNYVVLKQRKDYNVISPYAEKILRKVRSGYSQIEKDIFRAGEEREEWEKFLSDTLQNKLHPRLTTSATSHFSFYMEKFPVNENDGLRLISYYSDSVYKPLAVAYGTNSKLTSLKRNIGISRYKYYLYTRQNDSALRIATELSQYQSRVIDYRLYLISTYLAMGKRADADSLYLSMQPMKIGQKKILTDRQLYNLLNRLVEKNIASDSIKAFMNEFRLNTYIRDDID